MATSPEVTAARKVKGAISDISLDPTIFAYVFVDSNPVVQARMFAIMVALIEQWAAEYSKGTIEQYAVDAMRLRDTIDQFQMGVRNG
jgi:hypothetical protein